ncbi:uncharacterized protein LOC107365602 isoform X2 [Tetranychus urticae]|uniref:uncharacterized protein LOC107365602 isoform X2 n=1 Tax=Tetranychus urticae TaxID=32264 RepID=UPI00077BC850|nr:uncharacterized protein LOC107365602 isoform X2 [Tetranychus urticae]
MCRLLKNNFWSLLLVSFLYILVKVSCEKLLHPRYPHSHPTPNQPLPLAANDVNGYVDHQPQASYDHHHHEEKYPYQPYGFGYEVEDGWGNTQYRHEKGLDPWKVKGSYGYKDAWGIYRHVDYIADKWGFRANIKTNEPGTAPKDPAAVKMNSNPVPAGTHGFIKKYDVKDEVPDHSKTSYIYAKQKKTQAKAY